MGNFLCRLPAQVRGWIVPLTVCLLSCSCGWLPESSFNLAPTSRLPRWFSLPANLTRTDITVTLYYYMGPSGGTATFTLKDSNGEVLRRVQGRLPPEQRLPGGTGYPVYEVVTIDGLT